MVEATHRHLPVHFLPPFTAPAPPPLSPPPGLSSSDCHYMRAPVNQTVLVQWRVSRGHVTYVQRRDQETGCCADMCVCLCLCVRERAREGERDCLTVGQRAMATECDVVQMRTVATHEALDQL